MSEPVHFCLVLHNHQPIGNFEDVFEQAYRDSYRPFLDLFEEFPSLRLSLHTSGPLMQWLEQRHPDYVQRLVSLVAAGSIEIIGGPMYEPILTMLSSRDRIGQILNYSDYLNDLFQTRIRGAWIPERVWESVLTADLVRSGIEYTILDDSHFLAAGWSADELTGYFLTEDNGNLLRVFPGSEQLRYLIPFAEVERTMDYAHQLSRRQPGAILVFADDGEKFGSWPDTKGHVYDSGWLRRFFNVLTANSSWLKTSTVSEAMNSQPPRGKIYLPESSYREMTEWALPASSQQAYYELVHELGSHPSWSKLKPWTRAGNWRNFKVKYPEANEMYSRMHEVSQKLDRAEHRCGDGELLGRIQDHLYRSQCNCAYWHGAFGGIYLPHLRNAVYSELIAADTQLDYLEHGKGPWVEATSDDFNLDSLNEVRLANDKMIAYVAPGDGGAIYELDLRQSQHNLLATMQRRPEAYHQNIASSASQQNAHTGCNVESIHERMVCKQTGLDQRLQYDGYPRKSFLEHFYDNDIALTQLVEGKAQERGDFVGATYEAKLRRAASKVQLQLSREGNAWGIPLRITKALTLQAGSSVLDVAYLIEGLPQDRQLHLALEWNFAGLPAGAEDRYFTNSNGTKIGHLGSELDLQEVEHLGLVDRWREIDVQLEFNRATSLWTFPIATVSQSEGGFELVHQSVAVLPHWLIRADRNGRWALQMSVKVNSGARSPVLAPMTIQVVSQQTVG